ncbi:NUDIX domain-containing protein [Halobacillus salinarum]|uniref:NUDIX domain-containing protein n=1 Tax=Halobacillus salinarum TaxID=2932257 RepID=A0ABY4EKX3_9BACI|nr:NUDIX domain-containing protein [Halobacillus salinarum]UOQ44809.1 NUDIX domain-containing protein [Halobacillus salinarum]
MDIRFQKAGMKFNFRAVGVLVEQEHVLAHKLIGENHWSLPGGGVELGEPSSESVVRELKEELGIDVKAIRMPWVVENFFEYKGTPVHEIGMYFLLETEEEHVRKGPFLGLEGDQLIYEWIPLEQCGQVNLQPEFLAAELTKIPESTEHVTVKHRVLK